MKAIKKKRGQLFIYATILLFIIFVGLIFLTFYQVYVYLRDKLVWINFPYTYDSGTLSLINDIWMWFPLISLIGGLLLWSLKMAQKRRSYQ